MIEYKSYEEYNISKHKVICRVDAIDQGKGIWLCVFYEKGSNYTYEDAIKALENKLLSK